MNAHVSYITN